MDYIKYIIDQINGKKTYAVAVATIAYAIVYYGLSQHQWGAAVDLVLGASGLGALRHGVAKTSGKSNG